MKKLPWLLCHLSIWMALVGISIRSQNAPRLEVPKRLTNGAMDVKLNGIAGANYAIEASVNFSNWFTLSSGVATNGILSLAHGGASDYAALFYRGRAAADRLPPLTVGLNLRTNTTIASLASMQGGSNVLYGADGTRYTLTIPSNSIPVARIFTMTEVTSISGLPFAQGLIGAVRIEPADLAFWGAAALEITFPTNIDRRQITSFACKNDGAAFRLMIDRVGTNRILIPITDAGVYGSAVSTAQELDEVARRDIAMSGDITARSAAHSSGSWQATAFECQGANKAVAEAADQELRLALGMRGQEAAKQLGTLRKGESAEATGDPSEVYGQIEQQMCDFYMAFIEPRLLLATVNCALGQVFIRYALGLMRQGQLLAIAEGDNCANLQAIPFCPMFTNCMTEVRECCELGNRGSAKIAEVYALLHQEAILGFDCIPEDLVEKTIEACSSNVWTGSFAMNVSGYTNITKTSASGTTMRIESYDSTFRGWIIESTETGSADTGYIIDLRVAGLIDISDFSSDSVEVPGECGSIVRLQENRVVAATNSEYSVKISTSPGGELVMFAFNMTPTGDIGVRAVETVSDIKITPSCYGTNAPMNKTTTNDTVAVGLPMDLYQGRLTDPKRISGSQPAADPNHNPPLKVLTAWNFTRRTVPPP